MEDSVLEFLIQLLKAIQSPFSLLLDSSTDEGGKEILLAYISLYPTTHFLKAFEMEEAETGANLFDKLHKFFRDMNLIRELTWNLIGVATDGASNMIAGGGFQGILNLNVSQGRKHDLTQSRASAARIDAVTDKPLIWIHCMAHKIELALSDALMEDEEGRRQQSQFYKWRAFTTKYLNRLRNFFGTTASYRRRVLVEAGELLEDAPFLRLKKVIDIRRASSEKDSILNFVRIYKKLWLALQQISHPTSGFDQQTKPRAAGFLYVLKSLKFYRYVVYQLQLLDIIAKLSKSAQLPASTIWQTQAQLDHTISTVYASAENPNEYELTKPFIEAVQCKEAIAAGRFRMTALNERFWKGWEYGNLLNRDIIRYKLSDRIQIFEFSLSEDASDEERGRMQYAIKQANRNWEEAQEANIATELTRQRSRLALLIEEPASEGQLDEDYCR